MDEPTAVPPATLQDLDVSLAMSYRWADSGQSAAPTAANMGLLGAMALSAIRVAAHWQATAAKLAPQFAAAIAANADLARRTAEVMDTAARAALQRAADRIAPLTSWRELSPDKYPDPGVTWSPSVAHGAGLALDIVEDLIAELDPPAPAEDLDGGNGNG